jgi:type IV pilus assembly protein PilX
MNKSVWRNRTLREQNGVVLIVALIMLMLLSILASISVRGAASSEQIASQSRQKTLAQQAAEAALRYCEQQVQFFADSDPATVGFAPQAAPVGAGALYSWEPGAAGNTRTALSNWDAKDAAENPFFATGNLKTVPFTASADAGAVTYFGRQPQCMSQYLTPASSKIFVTTARGFGPEVKDSGDGSTPKGAEVWLQSIVTIN